MSAPARPTFPTRPRIKVCGLTRAADALAAIEAGADYLGFVFAPESRRRLDPAAAAALVASLPPGRAERVGVFVNETPARINAIAREAGLTMAQLHGEESPEDCAAIAIPVIKVLRLAREDGARTGAGGAQVSLAAALDRAVALASTFATPFVMIEPRVAGRRGGTGRPADWELAAALVAALPAKRFFLAGGLSPANVAQAIAAVRPFAVDASSGLEAAAAPPGIKDAQLIRKYVEEAKHT